MPTERKYENAAQRQLAYRQRMKSQSEAGLGLIPSVPGYRRWEAMKGRAARLLEEVISEMQNHYDERSGAWQEGERGEALLEMKESVEEVAAALREL